MSPDEVRDAVSRGEAVNIRPLAKAANVAPATLYRAVDRKEVEAIEVGRRRTIPPHVARKLLRMPDAPEAA